MFDAICQNYQVHNIHGFSAKAPGCIASEVESPLYAHATSPQMVNNIVND